MAISNETEFGYYSQLWQKANGKKSGFLPVVQGMDALGARLDMADRAQESIDLQYFLMSDDTAGHVVASALLRSADRGVRIRFLLDDVFSTMKDRNLHLLNHHPNIEVRLFNPVSRRGLYFMNFLGDFSQANRRMHNKSFTVDNALSIVGGRNIADEYFQLREGSVFSDFDMLAFGPIAQEISSAFDEFWNSPLAIPMEQVTNEMTLGPAEFERERKIFEDNIDETYIQLYQEALDSPFLQSFISGNESLFVASARVLMDKPDKLQNSIDTKYMDLAVEFGEVVRSAKQEVVFLTPYYIPGDEGVKFAADLVKKGVDVFVFTNSLASNNHVAVHSGYSRYREQVIDAGVNLYEVRADAGREMSGGEGPDQLTMHTKLALIDQRYLFVGSLNLDARSIEINTEMGVLLDSEELGGLMSSSLKEIMPTLAYRLVKNDKGAIEWHATIGDVNIIETSEPQASRWLRFKSWFLKISPESQL